ncbi:hypothetical protein ABE10_01095, partial [Bacillus toyonensis]|nr:hypothetical protein [Bacillus toyonensis]
DQPDLLRPHCHPRQRHADSIAAAVRSALEECRRDRGSAYVGREVVGEDPLDRHLRSVDGALDVDVAGDGDRHHVEATEVRPFSFEVEAAQLVRDDAGARLGEDLRGDPLAVQAEVGTGEDVG